MTRTPPPCRYPRRSRPLGARGLGDYRPYLARRKHLKIQPGGAVPYGERRRPSDFNSYGARRGNHEVMVRGTFANIRIRNQLLGGKEGGLTLHLPEGVEMSVYDAAMRYAAAKVPLVVLAGSEYGTGSSRDWAAKGTRLLAVKAVIAKSSSESIARTLSVWACSRWSLSPAGRRHARFDRARGVRHPWHCRGACPQKAP